MKRFVVEWQCYELGISGTDYIVAGSEEEVETEFYNMFNDGYEIVYVGLADD